MLAHDLRQVPNIGPALARTLIRTGSEEEDLGGQDTKELHWRPG